MEFAGPKNNWHYNIKLKLYARQLRIEGTKAEAYFLQLVLSKRQLLGYPFLRQRPILNYIADFMSKELMLVIELDELTHHFDNAVGKDKIKTEKLKLVGFTVLRFYDNDVLNDIEGVRRTLMNWIETSKFSSS